VSVGGDFHEDLVTAGLEVDFGIDGSGHEVAAVAADHVVFVAFFLEPEFEHEAVFAGETFEVSGVQL
jgi:hypothetical protein